MSKRQIENYMKKLSDGDPQRDLFINTVVPSLKGAKENNVIKFFCPFCNEKVERSEADNRILCFSSYYTFIRHLIEKHSNLLPNNGTIFNADRNLSQTDDFFTNKPIFSCRVCDVTFSRKEHLMKHYVSQRHIEKERKSFFEDESVISKGEKQLSQDFLGENRHHESKIASFGQNDLLLTKAKKRKLASETCDSESSTNSYSSDHKEYVKKSKISGTISSEEDSFEDNEIPSGQRPTIDDIKPDNTDAESSYDYILLTSQEAEEIGTQETEIIKIDAAHENYELISSEGKQDLLEISDQQIIDCLNNYEKNLFKKRV